MTGTHGKTHKPVPSTLGPAPVNDAASLAPLSYGRQSIDQADVQAVVDALNSNWLTTGPEVQRFEQEFAHATGAKYAVACSSGTAGLHLATMALNLGSGDKVIVPTMTFLATANAALYVNADVVFCDVDPTTGLMTADTFRAALDGVDNVKAVIPVHLAGQCVDMPAIRKLAQQHGIAVIEDACHALGANIFDAMGAITPTGSCAMSEMSVFSLHPVKTITTGEGGMVTTNDEELYKRLKSMRIHGVTKDANEFKNPHLGLDASGAPNPWYYEMHELGYNLRISDINCALGRSQLKKLFRFVQRRQQLTSLYDELIAPLNPAVRPLTHMNNGTPAWHLYVVLIDFEKIGVSRSTVMHRMSDMGVGTQVHYLPVHHQPYYQERYGVKDFPGADAYYAQCLSIPLYPDLQDEDVVRVVEALKAATGLR
ncbi:UDP-4-amino-4,6-dideoxy-N-acetyl-beta-L-altrosamine transaminase [Magnetovibrio sp.]|uniref:UDP-4-amino-4, 6-dideoxy-N-acetyl-beta-L-altrosamine transaminase n=1 Tax=Magnetovibrio sp. TaxID=2024836 RepID=UPI002F95F0A9